MTTAEITAYLAGVDLGRRAEVIIVDPDGPKIPDGAVLAPETAWACRLMTADQFRYWLLRGVADAWRQ
jgi:hypothetical protein